MRAIIRVFLLIVIGVGGGVVAFERADAVQGLRPRLRLSRP